MFTGGGHMIFDRKPEKKTKQDSFLLSTMHFFLAKFLLFTMFIDGLSLNKPDFRGMAIQTSAFIDCYRFAADFEFSLGGPAIATMSKSKLPGPSALALRRDVFRYTMVDAGCKSNSSVAS
jgi:hypothetical protein